MTHPPCRPRIVDLVFAGEPRAPGRRVAAGIAVVFALYGGLIAVVVRQGPSASDWSVQMAARIHELISAERAVDVSPPPPAPPPAPARPEVTTTVATARARDRSRQASARTAAPAGAARLAGAITGAVADFTGTTFVMGSASNYAGGTTRASAAGRVPATDIGAAGGPTPGAGNGAPKNLARAVSLDQAAWACPWPDEADAQQIDEQTVVIRARVRPDGGVDGVDVLSDPGFGFAQAARLCALRTHFEPARDTTGHRVAAASPPIRVHFFR